MNPSKLVHVHIYADYDILPLDFTELNEKFMEVFKSQETLLGSLSVPALLLHSLDTSSDRHHGPMGGN